MSLEYRIFETKRFLRALDRIPPPARAIVLSRLISEVYPALRSRPQFGHRIRKLSDWSPDTWRCRLGSWRLLYQIDETARTVLLITLAERKDA